MSRRRSDSAESMFGSDSFLDVVANIVGILIILIVLVGLRVRKAEPTALAEEKAALAQAKLEEREKQRREIEQSNAQGEEEYRRAAAEREEARRRNEELRRQRAAEQAKIDERRQEHEEERLRREKVMRQYEDEAARMQQEIASLADRLSLATSERERTAEEIARQEERWREAESVRSAELRQAEQSLHAESSDLERAKLTGEQLRKTIEELRRLLAEAEQQTPVVKQIRHFATPMARRIEQQELHFRCKGGRVAYTYLEELVTAARDQAAGRITRSTSRINGMAGPLGGFALKYIFARPESTVTEQLADMQYVRFGLVYWELTSESDFIGELADEAAEPNSALRVKLRSMPASKFAVTLWVYPDSFEVAKKVEDLLHDLSYTVSLRPLPPGIPIIGSPFGSATDSH